MNSDQHTDEDLDLSDLDWAIKCECPDHDKHSPGDDPASLFIVYERHCVCRQLKDVHRFICRPCFDKRTAKGWRARHSLGTNPCGEMMQCVLLRVTPIAKGPAR